MKPHRSFDPLVVAHLECAAWVAYYRRNWLAFLASGVTLARRTFGLPWPESLRCAWLVLRANQLWAPYPRNDPERARRAMERFYAIVKQRFGESFDPAVAAELEVQWWRVHREIQYASAERDDAALTRAFTQLYSHVYGVSERSVRLAAEERTLAMRHSDQWVREGREPRSPLIEHERAALVRSYTELLAAVHA